MSVTILGSVNMDVVLYVDELPRPGQTLLSRAQALFPGGKGANQAIACARSGVRTKFLGAVGDDAHGHRLLQFLRDEDVDVTHVHVLAGTPTGSAHICVSNSGENTIIVAPGANHEYSANWVGEAASDDGSQPKVVLSQFEMPLPIVEAFLQGHQGNALKILNPAPALPQGRKLLDLADIVVVNEAELEVYGGHAVAQSTSRSVVADIAREQLARPGQWIVVTLGSRGAIAVSDSRDISVEGIPVAAVDTTGAGDCYCGAMAACLAEGRAIEEALEFANAAASIAVTAKGAAPSFPLRVQAAALCGL